MAAGAPSTIDTNTRRGGVRGGGGEGNGGRGGEGEERGGEGVLPKRLKPGSGNHRAGVCVPSHDRKYLAGRPDFFALPCSLPGALYAIDALYATNSFFCKSLGSAIMVWFLSLPFLHYVLFYFVVLVTA